MYSTKTFLIKKQHKNPLNLYIVKQFVPFCLFCLQQLCNLALLKMKERKDKNGKTQKKGDKALVQEGKSHWIATTRLLCRL
jgi:hypothetical protein